MIRERDSKLLYMYAACMIIEKYILLKKGVRVKIQYPILPQHEDKFIKALNIACRELNIWI